MQVLFTTRKNNALFRIFVIGAGTNIEGLEQTIQIRDVRKPFLMYARSGFLACNHVECSNRSSPSSANEEKIPGGGSMDDYGILVRSNDRGKIVINIRPTNSNGTIYLGAVAIQYVHG